MNRDTPSTTAARQNTQTTGSTAAEDVDGCAVCGPEAVLTMVTGLCAKAGVPCQDAHPIEWVSSDNTIILIPGATLVARVTDLRFLRRMRQELQIAAFLTAAGIPVVEPAGEPPCEQLTIVADRVVSWWRYASGRRASWPQVASAIAGLHKVPVPPPRHLGLARLNPTATMTRQAATTSALPERDRLAYARHVDALAERWSESSISRQPGVLLHGDPHRDNAIATDAGVLLLDFETVAIGPALFDLRAPFAAQRFGLCTSDEVGGFLRAYGDAVPEEDRELVADVKVAEMCGTYVALCARYPHLVEQTRLRIASLTDPSLYAGWWADWHAPEVEAAT